MKARLLIPWWWLNVVAGNWLCQYGHLYIALEQAIQVSLLVGLELTFYGYIYLYIVITPILFPRLEAVEEWAPRTQRASEPARDRAEAEATPAGEHR